MASLYHKLLNWVGEDRQVALLTVVDSDGRAEPAWGAKLVVSEGGRLLAGEPVSDEIQGRLQAFARELFQRPVPRVQRIELEDGWLEVYGETVTEQPDLYLFGGGHVSKAVAEVAALAGFHPVVVEDRPQFASPERFPEGTRFHVGPWDEVVGRLRFHSNLYMVIVTRAHAYDRDVLAQVIEKPCRYLAMIGSRKKIATIFNALMKQGVSRQRLAQVHAPMGLGIGAQTPGEIAVSVVAEMIAVKYGIEGRDLWPERVISEASQGRD